MTELTAFFNTNIDKYLFALIILSGIFVTKYTKPIKNIRTTYKVLITSTIISIISFYINDCDFGCLPKYLITYTFATSFYEVIGKQLKNFIWERFREKP